MNQFIILDRDGVLNKLLGDNPPDSPMKISEIEILPGVPKALKKLNDNGYRLAIATNQPAAAKGKITYEELTDINQSIVEQIEVDGAVILSAHICVHRAEDNCMCRKPKEGLLQQVINLHGADPSISWMVGDRVVDILAGKALNFKTALIGYLPVEYNKLLEQNIYPDFIGNNLESFVDYLLGK